MDERYYRYCISLMEIDVPVGVILGTVRGSIIAALDLEAYDLSTPPLAYANPDRYPSDGCTSFAHWTALHQRPGKSRWRRLKCPKTTHLLPGRSCITTPQTGPARLKVIGL